MVRDQKNLVFRTPFSSFFVCSVLFAFVRSIDRSVMVHRCCGRSSDQRLGLIIGPFPLVAIRFARDAWQFERVAMCNGQMKAPRATGAMGAVEDLEVVLIAMRRYMGSPEPVSITNVKKWLREYGGRGGAIASMVSRLTKVRNTQAHALASSIVAEVELLVNGCGTDPCPAGSDSEGSVCKPQLNLEMAQSVAFAAAATECAVQGEVGSHGEQVKITDKAACKTETGGPCTLR